MPGVITELTDSRPSTRGHNRAHGFDSRSHIRTKFIHSVWICVIFSIKNAYMENSALIGQYERGPHWIGYDACLAVTPEFCTLLSEFQRNKCGLSYQEVILAQFSLHVHKGGLRSRSFIHSFGLICERVNTVFVVLWSTYSLLLVHHNQTAARITRHLNPYFQRSPRIVIH